MKWKQQRERLAELRQKQARLVLDTANSAVQMLQERLSQTALVMQARIGQSVTTAAWIAHYHHAAQLGQTLESAEARARQAGQALQQANAERAKIATEVEALIHLRQRQWQEHQRQIARLEQNQLDELGIRRWQGETKDEG